MEIYVVQEGDSIASIADRYHVTAAKLVLDNGLESSRDLVVGQTIVIVYPKETYTVQEGDSLASIALNFGIQPMQLLRNNPNLMEREYIYPGETITISFNTGGTMITNGFAFPYVNKELLIKTLPYLTYISIFNYQATAEGEVKCFFKDLEIIQTSIQYGTIPLMYISTLSIHGEINMEDTYQLLLNIDTQNRLIENILNTLKIKGYYGVNLVLNFISASTLKYYENYVLKLTEVLKSNGFLTFITINTNKQINKIQQFNEVDFTVMSKAADILTFIDIIWGTNYGLPLPVSNLPELENLLTEVRPTLSEETTCIGIPIIGYDWNLSDENGTKESSAQAITLSSALNLAHDVGAKIQFDDISKTPYFIYYQQGYNIPVKHIVWFVDARSIDAVTKLVSEYKLAGTGIWNVMPYFPQIWLVINSQFEILKQIPDILFE